MTDDPTLSARLRSRQHEITATKAEDLTLADRLTRRALDQRITIDLGDEAGAIPVEIRVPTFAELDRLGIVRATLASGTLETVPEYAAISAEMCEIVGGLCTDPTLGPGFWKDGLFPTDAIAIISELRSPCVLIFSRRASHRAVSSGTTPQRSN